MKARILICDDEEGIRRYLQKMFLAKEYDVETFADGTSLLARIEGGTEGDADILLQDVRMPDMDGIEVLKRVKKLRPAMPVVVMTAFGTIDAAVEAIKLGAYDYVTKPFPKEKILGLMENALQLDLLMKENRVLKEELSRPDIPDNIVFTSAKFREVYDLTVQVAGSDANILVLGESGTGKELIAGAIHVNSQRKGRRFLSINCAALSDTLLESQLFGHVRGAFTGAITTQKGLLEEADGGTLFLDEIGDVSAAVQAKLLRVIQEREFIPVGATKPKSVDIRFVAATNKDLAKEVAAGRFREDLYYRLNVITIALPPLRERREDIEPLAMHFLAKYARRIRKNIRGFTPEALQSLQGYRWPGNVRELENVVERAAILTRGDLVTPEVLPIRPREDAPLLRPDNLLVSLEEMEREHIERVLRQTGFHKSRTAEILGISRKTLDRKIVEYALAIPGQGISGTLDD
ncbi:two component, sigma54 specific, transcriptional regulator, Fis family [Geobacter metallireducens RCH3]|uniref:DNA-binding transcriptional regulator NtrC n=1 Tax=Geobacter metallireducens (strain ATCC 53774 / DSM 7210 / GS-15) TaxID=269799 RepID=Q39WS6_GEOMG|nr:MULTISPECIES: sigma-54 dependent transcriptional regulator [Geobacter]ABB31298.1 sigma-54-dependent transcriptional response regulator [Geobacter metallireducens GS-15]EHP86547.1 two component, sigma54 specific, transcriptional regulator, Fis family [Geobacter metallireducens RCH3]MBT1076160.1 sigma-54 dependent transcriptional regulator [Geobacter grbiciae]